jgi:RNA polymerase sigma-54 factor
MLLPGGLVDVLDGVIAHVDERGLLDDDVPAIAVALGRHEREVRAAIAVLRSVGPPGVAERDGIECLAAQAAWHVARGAPPALASIVPAHLEGVATGDHSGVASALGLSVEEIDEAVAFLRRRLRPFVVLETAPGDRSLPAAPDIIVRRHSSDPESLVVDVLGSHDLGLSIDPGLLRMQGVNAETREWLTGHIAEARTLLELIDRRAGALRRVAVAVVQAQRSFVFGGPDDHVPLTRTEVAAMLGLNVSTVSRAVQDKVVRLPDQRHEPLSAFFGSAVAAKALLARLLRAEPAPRPDTYFAERLTAAGHPVARRTVAKYRRSLERDGDGQVRTSLPDVGV